MTLTAIIQNNLAVAHLRANSITHASWLTTSALQHQQREDNSAVEHPLTGDNHVSSRIDQCMFLLDPSDQEAEEATDAFIYKAGIAIPTETRDPDIIVPILVFNKALALHLLADQERANARQHLQNAKELYELAYRSQYTGTSLKNVLFEFVLLNNLGVVCQELGDESTANEYFDYLLCVWMLFVVRDWRPHLHQVRGFLLNLRRTTTVALAA